MKLRYILFLLLIIPAFSAFAQLYSPVISPFYGGGISGSFLDNQQPARFNLQTGAGFSSGFGGGSLFSTYIAPSFNQPLGKKFTLSAGAVIDNTTYSNLPLINSDGQFSKASGNLTTYTLYTRGSYQVNDRLTVSGSAYKTINPAFNSRLNPDNLRMEAQGMSFGAGYRIGDNMHIGAEIRLEQGNSNFYSPYSHPASPFGNNRFGY
ncbi:MAG: hypothetical protein K0B15_01770 [Lentimicrobium sp.]|nr:hypothetical protein [Lentimicrobium sp.]